MRVLGADPGFANLGLVGIEFDKDIGDSKIIYAEYVRTKLEAKKRRVRQMNDAQRRHIKLYDALEKYPELLSCKNKSGAYKKFKQIEKGIPFEGNKP